jgi:colicin import membrane protein
MRMQNSLATLVLALAASACWAEGATTVSTDATQERRRIAAERQEAERRFEAARRECETRFAVSSCVEQARSERRRTLELLADRQAALDDAQRRQRAAERMQSIREKARQADERAAAPAASAVVRARRAPPTPRSPAPPAAQPHLQVTPQEAAQRRDERAKREQEAAQHRDAVLRRNAERDARKPPSAPLPVPSAPAASR